MATKTAKKTANTTKQEVTTPTLSPTFPVRFLVLSHALKVLAVVGESPVSGETPESLLALGQKVTGLHEAGARDLAAGVKRMFEELREHGTMVCPSCSQPTVFRMLPEFIEAQTDGTTHVCHFYLGGCNMGFAFKGDR